MNRIYAAIDFGSNALKLKIIQYSAHKIQVLEDLSKAVCIGEDVYELGHLKNSTVKEIVSILEYFKATMNTYQVDVYRAVATSAMREARNSRNVIEMIWMKTGVKVEIIEDTIEKFLTYKSIRDQIDNYREIRNGTLIVEMNAGGCDISIYSQNKLIKNDEIKLGTKVLKHILSDLEERTVDYPEVMNELIQTRTDHIWPSIKNKKISHYICIGGELRQYKHILFNSQKKIDKKDFERIYDLVVNDPRNYRTIIEGYGIDWYEFVPVIIINHIFVNLVDAEEMLIPDITLRDGVIAELIESDYKLSRYDAFNYDTISLAWSISRRYKSSEAHLKNVEKNSVKILKSLKSGFEFEPRDEMLLQLSVILHEIGKYTRMKDYLITSFDKIINLNILGVTHEEILTIAHICRLISSSEHKAYDYELDGLPEHRYGTVFKLAAIISIADALDKGKKQKIDISKIKLIDDVLTIYYTKTSEITLEEWSFEFATQNFTNTFGLIPELKEL